MNVNLIEEHYREKVVNEYEPLEDDLCDFPIDNICTVQQLEIFYRSLILDLYRRETEVNFSFRNDGSDKIDKRYFIVPLKLVEQPLDISHVNAEGQRVVLSYQVDTELLQSTERLYLNGYKDGQPNVIEWLRSEGLLQANAA